MIKTNWREDYFAAIDLPTYCILLTGNEQTEVRVSCDFRSGLIAIKDLTNGGKVVLFTPSTKFRALVPESWDSREWDLALDLMVKGEA